MLAILKIQIIGLNRGEFDDVAEGVTAEKARPPRNHLDIPRRITSIRQHFAGVAYSA